MTDFEDPRRFLARHKLYPKESFGQCFLIAEPVATSIVAALDARTDETVVEIGTGTAMLARMVAPHAARVVAIERDRELVAALRVDNLAANIELREEDAASVDYGALARSGPTAIVGNLPYQITGKLIRAILAPPVRWRVAVVMVQKEVAARLMAKPDTREWSVLGVFANAACTVEKVVEASPRCFHPPPRVTSTVVKLTPRAVPLAEETEAFVKMVHTVFAARRKTILNGLASMPNVGRIRAAAACAAAGIDVMRRPETLSVEQLRSLSEAVAAPTT